MITKLKSHNIVRDDFSWYLISLRRRRLRALYEGRCKQLEAARMNQRQPRYAIAITKYNRARNAWRAFRGLS